MKNYLKLTAILAVVAVALVSTPVQAENHNGAKMGKANAHGMNPRANPRAVNPNANPRAATARARHEDRMAKILADRAARTAEREATMAARQAEQEARRAAKAGTDPIVTDPDLPI